MAGPARVRHLTELPCGFARVAARPRARGPPFFSREGRAQARSGFALFSFLSRRTDIHRSFWRHHCTVLLPSSPLLQYTSSATLRAAQDRPGLDPRRNPCIIGFGGSGCVARSSWRRSTSGPPIQSDGFSLQVMLQMEEQTHTLRFVKGKAT